MGRIAVALSHLVCVLAALASPAHADQKADPQAPQKINRSLDGWPVDKFTLVDHHGKAFTPERLRDRWTFVLFGDTRCAAPCDAALAAMKGVSERIMRTDAILSMQVLFVSLDPARDTPELLRKYLAPYDRHFIGATGAPLELKHFAEELGHPAPTGDRRYLGTLVLIGPNGLARAEYLPPFNVPRLTADYLKMRALK
jgi:protein SCO1/2